MIQLRTTSASETGAVGEALAQVLVAGDLLLLTGDLGAGKTAFAQGLGRGLGVTVPITSPTFTLANRYQGERLLLHHLDVYRLTDIGEVRDLDLPELLDDPAVVAIEWGDMITGALPKTFLQIALAYGDHDGPDEVRDLVLDPIGPQWSARVEAITQATQRWARTC